MVRIWTAKKWEKIYNFSILKELAHVRFIIKPTHVRFIIYYPWVLLSLENLREKKKKKERERKTKINKSEGAGQVILW